MKNTKKYLKGYGLRGLLLGMLLATGCVGLETPPTNQFTDETYWTSQDNASSLLNMAYRQMNSPGWIFRDERLSDNLYNGYGNDDTKVIGNGQATYTTGLFNSVWDEAYGGIKTTHTFLANVQRVGMDPALEQRMRAEARFIRAFLFFQLTNWYGDVPFFTQDIDLPTARTIEPTAQATIVEWIHSELEEIAEILPTKEQYASSDRGRITAGAAMAFNARVALNFNDWERVKSYTSALVEGGEYGSYELFPDYQTLFYRTNQYNNEIILDIQYVTDQRTWGELANYLPVSLSSSFTIACPAQSLVDSYLKLDGSRWVEGDAPYTNRDPRMDMTIIRQGSQVMRRDGSTYTVNVDPNDANNNTRDKLGSAESTQTGYFVRKFYDPSPAAWTGGTSWSCNINFVALRYADVLLMYAEALNELGEMTSDVWDRTVRALRVRAGFPANSAALTYPGNDQDVMREVIRNERRVELALEGQRIYDIRRWQIAEDVLAAPYRGAKFDMSSGSLDYFTYTNNSFNRNRDYLWAIPSSELNINPNLGQNPGYDR